MEFQRLILIVALAFISLMLWNAWQQDYYHPQVAAPTTATQPITPADNTSETAAPTPPPTTISPVKISPASKTISVQTDVLNTKIALQGGNLVETSLQKYPVSLQQRDVPVTLLTTDPDNYYVAQNHLINTETQQPIDAGLTYTAEQTVYRLTDQQDTLIVILKAHTQNLAITKTFTFNRNEYLIHVNYQVENLGKQPVSLRLLTSLTRTEPQNGQHGFFQIHPFMGAAISTPEKRYQEIPFKTIVENPISLNAQGGWAAMVQHYFLSAWIPESQNQQHHFFTQSQDDRYTVGMLGKTVNIQHGQTIQLNAQFYSGPEVASTLSKIAPGLELTVSYGWLSFISVIIFWLMQQIYNVVGNWGWSIILVTVLIKLVFYHLSAKSYASMAKLRKLQPRIEALRERFGEDKQKMSQALMDLYREEKVNPLGGCLPILIQIPVFFALYMVLIESVELRQAPWILWIHDLSRPDPFFILPILMGITMFIQQKLSPPPPDPTQAKVMMFLPVVFTILFIQFPAGLVLYWVVNNALSILQQWYVTKQYESTSG